MNRARALLILPILLAAFAQAPFPGRTRASTGPKVPTIASNPVTSRTGGETIATATPITALPFSETGSTCGAINDYDEACPYLGSTCPDVVYSFAPPANMIVNLRLCRSYYDTKVFVYKDAWTPGVPYACNDDACSGPNFPWPYLSMLEDLPLEHGHTYYIVVDGYSYQCGTYVLDLTECAAEPCPDDAELENEPDCGTDYVDPWNGGCESVPPVFQPLCPAPGSTSAVLCGKSGTYLLQGDEHRDTDWYVCYGADAVMTASVVGEFPVLLRFVYGTDCGNLMFDSAEGGICESAALSRYVPSGSIAWIVVCPAVETGVPCGAPYVLRMDGIDRGPDCVVTGVRRSSWGSVKRLYR